MVHVDRNAISDEVLRTSSSRDLYEVKVKYLGKAGFVSNLMKDLANKSPEERKTFGYEVNLLKNEIANIISRKELELANLELENEIRRDYIDLTIPHRGNGLGKIHAISRAIEDSVGIFSKMGFSVVFGDEIEEDFYNFTALNVNENHPARQMQDTFYLNSDGKKNLLRTHTSAVQIRSMMGKNPPFKIVSVGKVYRKDLDATHSPMFHQIEVLYVDRGVNMQNLRYCISEFLQEFFEGEVGLRFRPSFFPFTEPSAEVDIGYIKQNGKIKITKDGATSFLEILGCGMVHPNVLQNVGVDPEEYQGFAFGVGIERLAMLKYGINDLRSFFEGDIRFLKYYGGEFFSND